MIAHGRHFRCRASAYSSNFFNAITLELRASLLAGNPHGPREAFFVFVFLCVFVSAWFCTKVEIVPYCIYMITLRHKPLYIKTTNLKTVPCCIYMITFMHTPLRVILNENDNFEIY